MSPIGGRFPAPAPGLSTEVPRLAARSLEFSRALEDVLQHLVLRQSLRSPEDMQR